MVEDQWAQGNGRRIDPRSDNMDSLKYHGRKYDLMVKASKLCSAVCTVTERGGNGLYEPHNKDLKTGWPVIKVLCAK